eukprot:TRINITY_DN22072_c0_g1_i1.p1 TRINITY_DN22072_c0_g1~~TRINITY_DN22072_c0_g1_i1.p1  ORF type:complete len:179 (-),score=55.63 TRINITY_DN22072_c0_g1_i1:260-721(-)
MKFSKLYDKAAIEAAKVRVVEVIEEESDEPLAKRIKKDDVSTRVTLKDFVKELERRPHCKKCNRGGENLELLLKHMIRKHYAREMNQQIGDNFANFWTQEQNKGTVKCKTCGKTLPASRAVVAHHWGIAHRKVIKIYFEEMYPKEQRAKSRKG